MKLLAINCGSSSIKFKLYDQLRKEVLSEGSATRIGEEGSNLSYISPAGKLSLPQTIANHSEGLRQIFRALTDKTTGAIRNITEIFAVGHRIAHGGDAFVSPTYITREVIQELERCIPLAPLHNPSNILGIKEILQQIPNVHNVAVIDTAFHQTIPPRAYLYAIPIEFYEKYGIRKWGFHGISYRYITHRTAQLYGTSSKQIRMIVCHLGNGASISAIHGGRSMETSMGFQPLSGLVMGTRPGDIDPGVILFFQDNLGMSAKEITDLLYRKSGLQGISGFSNDMREIEQKADLGDQRCMLAMDMFAYSVRRHIGAYAAVLGGIDLLVFTGGIGENSPKIRSMICNDLAFLGIGLDEKLNASATGREHDISGGDSEVRTMVIPTDEEMMIIMDTLDIACRQSSHLRWFQAPQQKRCLVFEQQKYVTG